MKSTFWMTATLVLLTGCNSPVPSGTPHRQPAVVLNGIDVLKRSNFQLLRGRRLGLITNHAGVDNERNPTIDLLLQADLKVVALFSPEHGIRGRLDEKIKDSSDTKTGLPVYSLYGERQAPTPEQLLGIDALVLDLQDIGCRFYTYPATLGHCLQAAGRAGLPMIVLDRVNPINGHTLDGPMHTEPTSFVGWHDVPLRHGMTIGEIARMLNLERQWHASLTVVPVEGWRRGEWYDSTGLPWINPSPNMRSLTAAALYPGVGLVEFCHVSVGRGTDRPFELVGAPYVSDRVLAAELNQAGLLGVRFIPTQFTPTANRFSGTNCHGVQIVLTNRDKCESALIGLALAQSLHRHHPKEFQIDRMLKLLGNGPTLAALKSGQSLAEIRSAWQQDLRAFERRRQPFLLYR